MGYTFASHATTSRLARQDLTQLLQSYEQQAVRLDMTKQEYLVQQREWTWPY